MLNHGGKLNLIAEHYGRPVEQWLDLSTGISPYSYPIPVIPEQIWRELPQVDLELLEAAKDYYKAANILPTAGSQSVIQLLPRYRLQLGFACSNVWLPKQGYKEHEKAWRDAGFTVCHYQEIPSSEKIQKHDVLVVINPNNPTGELYSKELLQGLACELAQKQAWLIIDEAFMDSVETPQSLMEETNCEHVFVLRSLGKFFGLAGIRVGFISANKEHLVNLQALFGPWHLNGPAAYIAKQALTDKKWQEQQRLRLKFDADALNEVLRHYFTATPRGASLFKTVYLANAQSIYQQLCQQGVYVRLTDELDALRFGIPSAEQLKKLTRALETIQA